MRTKKRFTEEHDRKGVIGRLSYWQPTGGHYRMPVFGPLGLLNLLETRLGLFRAECVNAQRATQHRECLKHSNTPDRFYHASFGVDPIETSASLLSWRDAWYLRGRSGQLPTGAGILYLKKSEYRSRAATNNIIAKDSCLVLLK